MINVNFSRANTILIESHTLLQKKKRKREKAANTQEKSIFSHWNKVKVNRFELNVCAPVWVYVCIVRCNGCMYKCNWKYNVLARMKDDCIMTVNRQMIISHLLTCVHLYIYEINTYFEQNFVFHRELLMWFIRIFQMDI